MPRSSNSLTVMWLAVLGVALAACTVPVPLPPKALELNRLGAAALAAGDLPTAEARVAVAIEYSPKFTEAWVNLGLIELRRGDLELARKHIKHARSLNPDLPAPHQALGLLEERCSRPKEAEAAYRAALAVDPGFAPARANLGRMLFASGRFDDAREQFLRLVEVAPTSLGGWLGLAESLSRLGRDRDGDVVIERARRRFGDDPEIVMLVARQMLRRGAYGEAEALLEPLTQAGDPKRSARAWAWLGVARLGSGDVHGAGVAADEALLSDSSDSVARYVLTQAESARPPDARDAPGVPARSAQ
jgi:Flp pilus assembly protein TadD